MKFQIFIGSDVAFFCAIQKFLIFWHVRESGGSAVNLTGSTIGSSDIRALEDITITTESSAVLPGAHKCNLLPVYQHFILNNET